MRYDRSSVAKGAEGALDVSEWSKSSLASPPSSRYGGKDEMLSLRPRRSRLENDIQQPHLMLPRRSSVRNGGKSRNGDTNSISGRRSVGHMHQSSRSDYNLMSNTFHNGQSLNYGAVDPAANRYGSIGRQNGRKSMMPSYAAEYQATRGNVLPMQMIDARRPRSALAEQNARATFYNSDAGSRNVFNAYDSGSNSTSEEGGRRRRESNESVDEEDEELRRYNLQARRELCGSKSATSHLRTADPFVEGGEAYYFGVVHLDLELVSHVMKTIPPPADYYGLQPIEKVAYIFYTAVYKKAYHNVEEFHKRFNREFYKFVCAGDSSDLALFKICKSMQDQHHLRQLEASKKAYEDAQNAALEQEKLDFNRNTGDGEQRHVAVPQPEEILNYGPMKFHTPHAFVTFGVGGKIVIVRPSSGDAITSSSNVVVDDLRSLLHADEQATKVIETVQNFKGPLIAGQTPTHSVRLYIQRQMDAIRSIGQKRRCEKGAHDVTDALLVWQLLEMMVQQHGRVTGPDVATLLISTLNENNKSVRDSAEKDEKTQSTETNSSKAVALERFTNFLLGGHVNEAIESALSDGLYADAMTLVRRLMPHDTRRIEQIEARFMALRSGDDPLTTLIAVASEQPPPVLTNPSVDDDSNWRRHAAVILANISTPTAMQTIYHLGLTLAKRDRHSAADFCLLAVCLLAGYDPFIPVLNAEGEEKSRKHIDLINSGSHLFDGEDDTAFGLSFADLHATDIYDYALRLGYSNGNSPLSRSYKYQAARVEYAKKLSSYGGFATDAFRYCMEIARSVWPHYGNFDRRLLTELCDLAEELQYVAAASSTETNWIASLRSMMGAPDATNPGTKNSAAEPEPVPPMNDVPADVFGRESDLKTSELPSEAPKLHDNDEKPLKMSVSEGVSSQSSQTLVQTVPTTTSSISTASTLTNTLNTTSSVAEQQHNNQVLPEPVTPPPMSKQPYEYASSKSPEYSTPISTPPPPVQIQKEPKKTEETLRSELEEMWSSSMPVIPTQKGADRVDNRTHPTTAPRTIPDVPSLQHKTAPVGTMNKTDEISRNDAPKNHNTQNTSSYNSRGWFSSLKDKVIKTIPSTNRMILPDDSAPSITWDPVLKKYVGSGVEEEVAAPPPPVSSSASALPSVVMGSNNSSTHSLRNVRRTGGSRYVQSVSSSQLNSSTLSPPVAFAPPTMGPLPTSFGFIPSVNDADDLLETVDPFSGEANSSIAEQNDTKDSR